MTESPGAKRRSRVSALAEWPATDWPRLQGETFHSPAGRLVLEAVRAHPPEQGWVSYTLALRAELPIAAGLLALQHPATGLLWLHLERDGPQGLRAEACQPLPAPA